MDRFAGVELGGTKIVCGIATSDGELLGRIRLDTRSPEATLPAVREALEALAVELGDFAGLGVGTFGPVHLDRRAENFGRIGPTPKTAWRDCDLLGFFLEHCRMPVTLHTDVTAAAFGEARWGAARGAGSVVYITVGTGVGAGALVNGRAIHGLMHPELGHIRVPRADGDDYAGSCPYHGDCVEGMAAGPAIVARWGTRLDDLPEDHPAHTQVAHYLSHLVVNVILLLAPEKIVLGGGVMSTASLYPRLREGVQGLLAGYVALPQLGAAIDTLIVPPGLGDDAGVLGAAAMALADQVRD